MSWYEPVLQGFEGLNQFLGQILPYFLPLLVVIFLGALLVKLSKGVALHTA